MGRIPGHNLSGPSRSDLLTSLHQPQGASSRKCLPKAHLWVWSLCCVPSSICVHTPPSRSPPNLDCPGHPGVTPCLSAPHSTVSTEYPDWFAMVTSGPPVSSTVLGCGHARGRLDAGHVGSWSNEKPCPGSEGGCSEPQREMGPAVALCSSGPFWKVGIILSSPLSNHSLPSLLLIET